jgi:enamine deaminase RidA (YjgF/YER057c/UK114 family)
MTNAIDTRLRDMKLSLPAMAAPAANYVPFVKSGGLLFISGQLPMGPKGLEYAGIIGQDFDVEAGRAAAKLCALNVLAVIQEALGGDWGRFRRLVKITGFVNAVSGFAQTPEVVNGASDLFVAVLGEVGRHARAAVGAGSLPRNAAVELEAIAEIS